APERSIARGADRARRSGGRGGVSRRPAKPLRPPVRKTARPCGLAVSHFLNIHLLSYVIMRRIAVCALILAHVLPNAAAAQDTLLVVNPSGRSLDLGIAGYGLSLGNSPVWTGLRVNLTDRDVRRVDGINITLWRPGRNPNAELNGLALGVVAPEAGTIRGAGVGLVAVVAERSLGGLAYGTAAVVTGGELTGFALGGAAVVTGGLRGIAVSPIAVVSRGDSRGAAVAGLGTVAEGSMRGINVAGLGTVAQGNMAGVNLSGLGTVAQGHMRGINFAGLGTVAQGDMRGINLAGLGVVSQGDMRGLNLAGLATVAQGDMAGTSVAGLANVAQGSMTGLNLGGLANVAQGRLRGINLAGLALVGSGGVAGLNLAGLAITSDRAPISGLNLTLGAIETDGPVRWVSFAGYKVDSPDVRGLSINPIRLKAVDLSGVAIGGYNRVEGVQRGLTIGIFNWARELRGVQIGLLNYAGNNEPPFRLVPILNAHF